MLCKQEFVLLVSQSLEHIWLNYNIKKHCVTSIFIVYRFLVSFGFLLIVFHVFHLITFLVQPGATDGDGVTTGILLG